MAVSYVRSLHARRRGFRHAAGNGDDRATYTYCGGVMVIPHENKLVQYYIQLTKVTAGGGQLDRSTITPQMILSAAQKILAPYTLAYTCCDWWTAYQVLPPPFPT